MTRFMRAAALAIASFCAIVAHAAEADHTISAREGWLSVTWGDGPASAPESHVKVSLTDDKGNSRELAMSNQLRRGGLLDWDGRRVRVHERPTTKSDDQTPITVAAVQLLEQQPSSKATVGSHPWVSLLCKFADIADEPKPLAFFQAMYANMPAGLDHYWREVSYNIANVQGSIAVDWITLPGKQADYAPTPGSGSTANLNQVFDDCTAAADALVDFSGGGTPFAGINIMLNDRLDCCAWGGGRFATLDGGAKGWDTTWNPPFSYANAAVLAHEMGHGFGLPHANNSDQDSTPYDNPWAVMSSATSSATKDPVYGLLGKHLNAYHKDRLGWISAERRYEAPLDASASILLDHIALANPAHYQMAMVPVSDGIWYTVEARQRDGLYDGALPGAAVIIHEVVVGRSEPSWVVDGDLPPATFSDNPGTMWIPGERFVAANRGVEISVDSATATGFAITIKRTTVLTIFQHGFEQETASTQAGAILFNSADAGD